MDGYFIGIDESNMGRFPEFHVAAASRDLSEGIVRKKRLVKYRKDNSLYDMEQLLSDPEFNYSFLLVTESVKDLYTQSFLRSHIVANLVPSLDLDPKSIERVFIDGPGNSSRKDEIVEIMETEFNFDFVSKIEFKPIADELIKVVNVADAVAHYLFQQYRVDKKNLSRYEDHMARLSLPSTKDSTQKYANKPAHIRGAGLF